MGTEGLSYDPTQEPGVIIDTGYMKEVRATEKKSAFLSREKVDAGALQTEQDSFRKSGVGAAAAREAGSQRRKAEVGEPEELRVFWEQRTVEDVGKEVDSIWSSLENQYNTLADEMTLEPLNPANVSFAVESAIIASEENDPRGKVLNRLLEQYKVLSDVYNKKQASQAEGLRRAA